MMEPDAVDHDARGERVIGAGDVFGKFEPAAPFFEWLRGSGREDLKKLAVNDRSARARIANMPNSGSMLRSTKPRNCT